MHHWIYSTAISSPTVTQSPVMMGGVSAAAVAIPVVMLVLVPVIGVMVIFALLVCKRLHLCGSHICAVQYEIWIIVLEHVLLDAKTTYFRTGNQENQSFTDR